MTHGSLANASALAEVDEKDGIIVPRYVPCRPPSSEQSRVVRCAALQDLQRTLQRQMRSITEELGVLSTCRFERLPPVHKPSADLGSNQPAQPENHGQSSLGQSGEQVATNDGLRKQSLPVHEIEDSGDSAPDESRSQLATVDAQHTAIEELPTTEVPETSTKVSPKAEEAATQVVAKGEDATDTHPNVPPEAEDTGKTTTKLMTIIEDARKKSTKVPSKTQAEASAEEVGDLAAFKALDVFLSVARQVCYDKDVTMPNLRRLELCFRDSMSRRNCSFGREPAPITAKSPAVLSYHYVKQSWSAPQEGHIRLRYLLASCKLAVEESQPPEAEEQAPAEAISPSSMRRRRFPYTEALVGIIGIGLNDLPTAAEAGPENRRARPPLAVGPRISGLPFRSGVFSVCATAAAAPVVYSLVKNPSVPLPPDYVTTRHMAPPPSPPHPMSMPPIRNRSKAAVRYVTPHGKRHVPAPPRDCNKRGRRRRKKRDAQHQQQPQQQHHQHQQQQHQHQQQQQHPQRHHQQQQQQPRGHSSKNSLPSLHPPPADTPAPAQPLRATQELTAVGQLPAIDGRHLAIW
ncbi:hypothetical protein DIPPA_34111 [Diplonema papillatum]|nr:hypothetical protein DIPPA_34111 [Diplonema papillatum]